MKRIVIFGNSGSGKSFMAGALQREENLPHLDLDSIAWSSASPPERRSIAESRRDIDAFTEANPQWVIEGCYSDLLEIAMLRSSEIIFLNIPIESCISNAKKRPWEPHKYVSKEAQDANLPMLIDWIRQYTERDDVFSKSSHMALFEHYECKKVMVRKHEKPP
ncbi:MAG: shikimate kinase [Verrucomicrobiota bacterium]